MSPESEDFGGSEYRFGRMNAMKQFHVMRRLAPVATRMSEIDFAALLPRQDGPTSAEPSADETVPADQGPTLLSKLNLMQPLADALSKLSDADCEYIIGCCMDVVTRRQGPTWVRIWNSASARPMFDDIDLPVLMSLTVRTLMENLSNFFPARAPEFPAARASASNT